MRTKDTTDTTNVRGATDASGAARYASAFVRLGEIFRAAGRTVDLLAPYPPLPDPDSPRERYRRATIERAMQQAGWRDE